MSMFQDDHYRWRETYFVLFDASQRPTLKGIEKTLHKLSDRFQVTNGRADSHGRFESLTLVSPDDYAALDISFIGGEEVLEQAKSLVEEMKPTTGDAQSRLKLARLPQCDARFDVLHFEQVVESGGDEGGDEILDPSTLLIVLNALVEMTDGIGVDPQSGGLL
ncbi:MAG: hypothetical protein ACYC35_01820 [Pirellulales bacterium]|jgi:hypothetical protein